MDIEELVKNIGQYADITTSFYKHYIDNPDLSFDKLLKDTLKSHSYKKKLNKIILRKSYMTLIEKGILELDSDLIKLLIKVLLSLLSFA